MYCHLKDYIILSHGTVSTEVTSFCYIFLTNHTCMSTPSYNIVILFLFPDIINEYVVCRHILSIQFGICVSSYARILRG